MGLFGCKCCQVLKAENEHLRKWLDRLMEQKAPDPADAGLGAMQRKEREDDLIFSSQE